MTTKILIVDDNKFPRKMLIKALPSDLNAEITEATNGREALDAIAQSKPDIMFLDLTMPEMDGFEVLQHLHEAKISLNIVVLSADVQEKAIERVKDLGAREFLKKPFVEADIVRILRELELN